MGNYFSTQNTCSLRITSASIDEFIPQTYQDDLYVSDYDFEPEMPGDLPLVKGHVYLVHGRQDGGWLSGRPLLGGTAGVFPGNHVTTARVYEAVEDWEGVGKCCLTLSVGHLYSVVTTEGADHFFGRCLSTGRRGIFPRATVRPFHRKSVLKGCIYEETKRNIEHPTDSVVKAEFSYKSTADDELSFREGDSLTILQRAEGGLWYLARDSNGSVGMVPWSYIAESTTDCSKTLDSGSAPYIGFLNKL